MDFNLKKDINYLKAVLNLSDNEVCNFLNISRMSLNRWANNKSKPTYETLEKIYNQIYEHNIYLNRLKEEMYNSSLKENHVLLFHGSKKEIIGTPSIQYSEEKKDFGKGFYLGESLQQSANFITGYNESSIYIFDFSKENINIKEFNVCKERMILIAYYRGRLDEYKNSKYLKKLLNKLNNIDVIIAPIADNTMYTILDDFINGIITDLQCVNALSANRLGKQYVFLNDNVINKNLICLERCFYPQSERKENQAYKLIENEVGKNKVKIALRQYAGKGKYIEELLK